MARLCSDATNAQIARLDDLPTKPAWLKVAISDARRSHAMSLQRERRMCAALGIDPPPLMVSVPACPDCGTAHTAGRCNGEPVIVTLKHQPPPKPAWVIQATRNIERLEIAAHERNN